MSGARCQKQYLGAMDMIHICPPVYMVHLVLTYKTYRSKLVLYKVHILDAH